MAVGVEPGVTEGQRGAEDELPGAGAGVQADDLGGVGGEGDGLGVGGFPGGGVECPAGRVGGGPGQDDVAGLEGLDGQVALDAGDVGVLLSSDAPAVFAVSLVGGLVSAS